MLNGRYSVTGCVFKLCGGSISWFSKKQKTVALSTCEAEYMALSFTVQELLWLRQLMLEVDPHSVIKSSDIFCDNRGAIQLAKNSVTNPRSKHIDVRHHFLREHVESGIVNVMYTPSENMLADSLTKPLNRIKHEACVQNFGFVQ